jgi:hypothetical protein
MNMTFQRRLVYGCGIVLLALSFGGCAVRAGYGDPLRIGDGLNIYAPFDNSRDWGPSYLVGSPDHHFGYGTRVDDGRSTQINERASPPDPDPARPTRSLAAPL